MTSQHTLRQFYQRFKEEHALLLTNQCGDSLYVTMDMLRIMYAYFLQHGQEQRALLERKTRPELNRVYAFFDEYRWQLDEQRDEYCVQPDVLGYVFEQQINQKQLGAYYTHEDVVEYITQKTILPYLLDTVTRIHPTVIIPLQALLLRTQPERYIHTAVSHRAYLPTETEREYAIRQTRYKQLYALLQQGQICAIADMITYNLDIRRFVLDMLTTCTHAPVLLTFYRTLEHLTILDPTCGTGAFLLSAMTLLEELYSACLQRMQQCVEEWDEDPGRGNDDPCHTVLRTLLTHVMTQGIGELLVHTLYGIEIMPEAVEICIMRLTLMHVGMDRTHLCRGFNSLRPRTNCLLQQGRNELKPLQCTYPDYLVRSCNLSMQWNVYTGNALIDETWQTAFPEHRDGFDVIIGNPPFVEYGKVAHNTMQSDGNGAYGNLYAEVVERSLSLCHTAQSYIGFVVPLSLCGGERFDPLRKTLLTNVSLLWLANFDIFPCRLFEGAYQRLTLLLGKRSGQDSSTHETYVTHIQRWYTPERATLIKHIVYTRVRYRHRKNVFPKFGSWLQEEIVQKIITIAGINTLSLLVSSVKTEYALYYQEATNTWVKATRHIPFYKKNSVVTRPRHGRFLYFEDADKASVVCALMNSSLFYVWFATYSDGFHLSHTLVQGFPVLSTLYVDKPLLALARCLEEDIRRHAVYSTRNTKTGDRIEIEEYRMAYSKPIIDEIDGILARYYGFTDEELDFILHYDNKYRIGR